MKSNSFIDSTVVMQVKTNRVKRSGGRVTCRKVSKRDIRSIAARSYSRLGIVFMFARRKKATSGAMFQALPTARTSITQSRSTKLTAWSAPIA